MRKIDMITELYRRTLKELTSSNRAWMDFLKTAAFGYKADESLDVDDLAALREFNTPEVINVLGTATGDLSEICLREIERTVRAYEKNKIRTFAEAENVRYNNPENNNTFGKAR